MNKAELAAIIAGKFDLSKKKSDEIITSVLDNIAEALAKKDNVSFIGFGNFSVKERAARKGRNPATGAVINIAASNAISFKAGKKLKDSVNR